MTFEDYCQPEPNSGCLLWLGPTNAKGYGYYGNTLAHRYTLKKQGHQLDGAVVMHKCDQPACVNSDHLKVGTIAENNADMIAKGRQGFPNGGSFGSGEAHKNAILTAEMVRAFRASGKTAADLSEESGINRRTISDALHRKTWATI